MPNLKLPESPKNTNPSSSKEWMNIFYLFIGAVKAIVLVIFLIILYTFFGGSFDFNFQKAPIKPVASTSSRTIVDDNWDKVENGIHVQTGLIYTDNFDIIRANCTACHSGKLIAQNRATREGWQQMIRWMQATQGLWDLGKNEPKILDYLATYYAPTETGRRANLDMAAVEWYILKLEEK